MRPRRPRFGQYLLQAVGLIQHKREAFWFYRFLSLAYDSWVNPLFWTLDDARAGAGRGAAWTTAGLQAIDVGAGTGFATEGIVARRRAPRHPARPVAAPALARARQAGPEGMRRVVGDAEALPFATTFDRYVSAGSIEYWPDPPAASPRPTACSARWRRADDRPVAPGARWPRRWPTCGCCSRRSADYGRWMEERRLHRHQRSSSRRTGPRQQRPYALAMSGVQARSGPARRTAAVPEPPPTARRSLGAVGGRLAAGAAFVPSGWLLALRARRAAADERRAEAATPRAPARH